MKSSNEIEQFVLRVGSPLRDGGFSEPAWNDFAQWSSARVDEILLYFHRASEVVPRRIAEIAVSAVNERFPDADAPLLGLRLRGRPDNLREVLRVVPFEPERGVSHMMCMAGQRLIASLETDDGTNFLILELTPEAAADLASHMTDLPANVRQCREWSNVIDLLVGSATPWKALGATARVSD